MRKIAKKVGDEYVLQATATQYRGNEHPSGGRYEHYTDTIKIVKRFRASSLKRAKSEVKNILKRFLALNRGRDGSLSWNGPAEIKSRELLKVIPI